MTLHYIENELLVRLLQNQPEGHYNSQKTVKEVVKRCVLSCFLKVLRSVRLRTDGGSSMRAVEHTKMLSRRILCVAVAECNQVRFRNAAQVVAQRSGSC
jgi:hypothetical protein